MRRESGFTFIYCSSAARSSSCPLIFNISLNHPPPKKRPFHQVYAQCEWLQLGLICMQPGDAAAERLRYEKWTSLSIYSAVHSTRGPYNWSRSSPIIFCSISKAQHFGTNVRRCSPSQECAIKDINLHWCDTSSTSCVWLPSQGSATGAGWAEGSSSVQYCSLVACLGFCFKHTLMLISL